MSDTQTEQVKAEAIYGATLRYEGRWTNHENPAECLRQAERDIKAAFASNGAGWEFTVLVEPSFDYDEDEPTFTVTVTGVCG